MLAQQPKWGLRAVNKISLDQKPKYNNILLQYSTMFYSFDYVPLGWSSDPQVLILKYWAHLTPLQKNTEGI